MGRLVEMTGLPHYYIIGRLDLYSGIATTWIQTQNEHISSEKETEIKINCNISLVPVSCVAGIAAVIFASKVGVKQTKGTTYFEGLNLTKKQFLGIHVFFQAFQKAQNLDA